MQTRRPIGWVCAVLLVATGSAGCDLPAPPAQAPQEVQSVSRAAAEAKENPGRVRDEKAKCGEVSEEGKQIIEKARAWIPVVNGNKGDKPLSAVAADYVGRGLYEICWGASRKGNGRWKVWYSYIDIQGGFREAEWEYDPATDQFQTFDNDSMQFWTGQL